MLWTIVSAVVASTAVLSLFPIDMVVTDAGRVVSLRPTIAVQPLEAAIVRAINVHEGQSVRAGDKLARLDPTFYGGRRGRIRSAGEEPSGRGRSPRGEASGSPYQPTNPDAWTSLQVAIFGQRQAQ